MLLTEKAKWLVKYFASLSEFRWPCILLEYAEDKKYGCKKQFN